MKDFTAWAHDWNNYHPTLKALTDWLDSPFHWVLLLLALLAFAALLLALCFLAEEYDSGLASMLLAIVMIAMVSGGLFLVATMPEFISGGMSDMSDVRPATFVTQVGRTFKTDGLQCEVEDGTTIPESGSYPCTYLTHKDGTLHRGTLRVTGVKVGLYDEHGNLILP